MCPPAKSIRALKRAMDRPATMWFQTAQPNPTGFICAIRPLLPCRLLRPCARAGCWPMWLLSSDRSISYWVKSTGKEGADMVDYEKLAAQAKAAQDAADFASRKAEEAALDPKVYFQRVTTHLNEEMNKANVELLKRGIDPISRNHLPNFDGIIFLVFG